MAPEIFNGDYGPKCDMWAVGVVLYMIVTGQLPFVGSSRTGVKKAICEDDFEKP